MIFLEFFAARALRCYFSPVFLEPVSITLPVVYTRVCHTVKESNTGIQSDVENTIYKASLLVKNIMLPHMSSLPTAVIRRGHVLYCLHLPSYFLRRWPGVVLKERTCARGTETFQENGKVVSTFKG